MLFVALILPLVVLAAACLLERFEARVCGAAPGRGRGAAAGVRAATTARPSLDTPTLRLVRERAPLTDTGVAAQPALRQAS